MARPRKKIDPEQVEQLAGIGCPADEIAAVLGVSQDTVERRFADIVKKGHQKLKSRVRSMLFSKAKNGDTAAVIFLSKAVCHLKEHPDVAINVSATAVGNQIIFDDQTKKQLEDFHVALQRRVYGRTHTKEPVTSGNGDQTALN